MADHPHPETGDDVTQIVGRPRLLVDAGAERPESIQALVASSGEAPFDGHLHSVAATDAPSARRRHLVRTIRHLQALAASQRVRLSVAFAGAPSPEPESCD